MPLNIEDDDISILVEENTDNSENDEIYDIDLEISNARKQIEEIEGVIFDINTFANLFVIST